jgi:hypothetical protein
MAWLANVTKHFLGFVNKVSFCYHSTIKNNSMKQFLFDGCKLTII